MSWCGGLMRLYSNAVVLGHGQTMMVVLAHIQQSLQQQGLIQSGIDKGQVTGHGKG